MESTDKSKVINICSRSDVLCLYTDPFSYRLGCSIVSASVPSGMADETGVLCYHYQNISAVKVSSKFF